MGGRGERNKYFRAFVKKTEFWFMGFISSGTTSFPLYFNSHRMFSSNTNGFTISLTESAIREYRKIVIIRQGEREMGYLRATGAGTHPSNRKCKVQELLYFL